MAIYHSKKLIEGIVDFIVCAIEEAIEGRSNFIEVEIEGEHGDLAVMASFDDEMVVKVKEGPDGERRDYSNIVNAIIDSTPAWSDIKYNLSEELESDYEYYMDY